MPLSFINVFLLNNLSVFTFLTSHIFQCSIYIITYFTYCPAAQPYDIIVYIISISQCIALKMPVVPLSWTSFSSAAHSPVTDKTVYVSVIRPALK